MERFSTHLFQIQFVFDDTCLTSSIFWCNFSDLEATSAGSLKCFPFSACKPRFLHMLFHRENRGKSHFCAGRPQKTSYFTCPERHAARWDALGPSKSIENMMVFSDFHVFCCSPTPSNAQAPVLEPFGSHLEPFWCHLGVILGPSGSHFVQFGCPSGRSSLICGTFRRYPRPPNAQEAILELFGSYFV